MQTNIPINLQANIRPVIPVPDKKYTQYYRETITFNLSNKGNHL